MSYSDRCDSYSPHADGLSNQCTLRPGHEGAHQGRGDTWTDPSPLPRRRGRKQGKLAARMIGATLLVVNDQVVADLTEPTSNTGAVRALKVGSVSWQEQMRLAGRLVGRINMHDRLVAALRELVRRTDAPVYRQRVVDYARKLDQAQERALALVREAEMEGL